MVNLDKCDIKGCENSWAYRVSILDMCEFHYKLWKENNQKMRRKTGFTMASFKVMEKYPIRGFLMLPISLPTEILTNLLLLLPIRICEELKGGLK